MDDAVIVALGSNLAGSYGASQGLLDAALTALPHHGATVSCRSGWWRSAAWPDPRDPPFLNGVVMVETALSAEELLARLHAVEAAFGRDREVANGPRTLDLDLVAYGRTVSDKPALPHPRAADRLFVMGPLAQIAPHWRHPISALTAAELAQAATVGLDAAPI